MCGSLFGTAPRNALQLTQKVDLVSSAGRRKRRRRPRRPRSKPRRKRSKPAIKRKRPPRNCPRRSVQPPSTRPSSPATRCRPVYRLPVARDVAMDSQSNPNTLFPFQIILPGSCPARCKFCDEAATVIWAEGDQGNGQLVDCAGTCACPAEKQGGRATERAGRSRGSRQRSTSGGTGSRQGSTGAGHTGVHASEKRIARQAQALLLEVMQTT